MIADPTTTTTICPMLINAKETIRRLHAFETK
eukprot:COSAG02_NODE_7137_length_3161_cov_2.230568_3_plen_31_part_01